ncbi:hypothetical protein ACVWYG_001193 [Pedobacter sp. UYEF25]
MYHVKIFKPQSDLLGYRNFQFSKALDYSPLRIRVELSHLNNFAASELYVCRVRSYTFFKYHDLR